MSGTLSLPFSVLFHDTCMVHGTMWAYAHYVIKHNMPRWEFKHWCKATGVMM